MADTRELNTDGTPVDPMDALVKSISAITDSETSDQFKLLQLLSIKNKKAIDGAGSDLINTKAEVLLTAVKAKATELFPELSKILGSLDDGMQAVDTNINTLLESLTGNTNSKLAESVSKVQNMTKDAFDSIFKSSTTEAPTSTTTPGDGNL